MLEISLGCLQVLFFIRLFADLTGRTLPRIQRLAITSQRLLFAVACLALATVPLFFVYMKAPRRYLNDYLVIGMLAKPQSQGHSILHTC